MKIFASMTLVLFASLSTWAANPNCPDKHEVLDNMTIQSISGNSDCFLSIRSRNAYQTLVYRDFLFDDKGLFMIFNSYGAGPDSEMTGAREFYFFPRKTNLITYQYNKDAKRLKVRTPSDKLFVFDTENAALVSISNTTFTIDSKVNPHNNGGVEIKRNDGVYLDLGFQKGESPAQNPNRRVTFKDAQQNNCEVKNSDLFKYTADLDSIFRFTDAQLQSFLQKECSNLKL